MGSDAIVTGIAVTDGTVTFTAAKAGATEVAVKATIDDEDYVQTAKVYVKADATRDLKGGDAVDFTGENGKGVFYTTDMVAIRNQSGGEAKYHGKDHGLDVKEGDTFTMKVPADKTATITMLGCQHASAGYKAADDNGDLTVALSTETVGQENCKRYTVKGASGTVVFTAGGQEYLHGIKVELTDPDSASLTVTPASVSMRAGTSKDVAVEAQNFAETFKLFAIPADATVATATVAADGKKVTITGVAVGTTKVYVGMAETAPADATAAAAVEGVEEVAVEVTEALAAGTQEWIWGGDGHNADTFEADSAGLKMPSLQAVKYHNSYGILANPVKNAEDPTVIDEAAAIGIPVEGPSKITVYTGYTWDISLGDAQDPARYGSALATSDSGKEQPQVFNYYGGKGYVTLTANGSASTYIHGIKVEADSSIAAMPKVVVWDLFGTLLDETLFDNRIDVEMVKSFYGDPIPEPPTLGSFATPDGEFAFVAELKGDADRNDYRLRTAKEELKDWVHSTNNYTKNDVAAGDDPYAPTLTTYGGSFQSNGGLMTFKIKASAGDKLTFTYADSSTAGGVINMNYIDAADAGTEGKITKVLGKVGEGNGSVASVYVAADGVQTFTNAIKEDGTWAKAGVARFYRETPSKAVISGNLTVGEGVSEGYKLVATDDASGVEYEATVSGSTYSIEVNNYLSGATFTLSTQDADGVIVGSGAEVALEAGQDAVSNDVAVIKVELVNVSGSVTGLGDALADVVFQVGIPEGKIYVPKLVPAADGTYTAQLEKGVEYTLSAKNVNDYVLNTTTLKFDADATDAAVAFAAKPVYAITVETDPAGVDLSAAKFTFTNFSETDDKHEGGYIYTFTGAADIKLRDGQYKIKVDGAPYPTKLVSDLKVNGAATTKKLSFLVEAPTKWVFTKDAFTADVLAAKDFNFLKLDGTIAREEKDHAIMKATGKMSVPVSGPCKVNVTVYYAAAGTIGVGEDTVEMKTDVSTGTTSASDVITYEYTGAEAGYVDIIATDTTYVLQIEVVTAAPYAETLTVGKDKQFQTIQAAVDAATKMERPNNERVTIMIDPGDYEEMIWVRTPNITFKNAAANPSIKLKDKGVKTEDGAVRITWYYGCGFDYYSMGPNSKFSAEQLAVNKENGYVSHPNSAGGGSNNECWWNATTVIAATGFQAEDIIFENSFNQYVSAAAAADVIVPNAGAKQDNSKPRAELPLGSTEVQRKAYVERAAAIALANDKASDAFFDHCAFVGHQDVIYGGRGVKAAFYDCDVMGACDYIFGPMTAVFAKCDLILNVGADSDANDVAYIIAPQNGADVHGYLMYNCSVRNVEPGVESAGTSKSAVQHAFGRAWGGATAEGVFYETLVGTNANGKSLIGPEGWNTGLGSSKICAEYHTHDEAENVDYTQRIFGGVLTEPKTAAGAELSDYAGWLGGWNPFAKRLMAVEGCPENPYVPADTSALKAAVTAADAYAVDADVKVMPVGTKASAVAKGQKFVTQDVADAFAKAIADAKDVLEDLNSTQADVDKAVTDLNAAVAAYKAAILTGTKGGSSSSGGRPSSRPTETEQPTNLPFTDVKADDWFYSSVKKAFDKGLMKGTSESTFAPTAKTTRAMVATILYRLAGEKKTDVENLFNDVAADTWYTDAVAWAAEQGIIKGYNDTTFGPENNVTREQLVVMLYRYANATVKEGRDLSAFHDAADVSEWAVEAMTWAVDKGIILGRGNGQLDPTGLASRAEVCTVLVRFLEMK